MATNVTPRNTLSVAELKALTQRQMQALGARDLAAHMQYYADDAELVLPGLGALKGKQTIAGYRAQQLATFPDADLIIKRIVGEEDTIVAEYEFVATHGGPLLLPTGQTIPATGKRVRIKALNIRTFYVGKVTSQHEYFDLVDVFSQLGVMPNA